MTPIKVSVLVPTFNVGPFLAENLDVLLAQDFSDFELLLSDNCSTDGTFDVIQHYAARDPRIRCWQNPANLGITANINRCLEAARGEFVKFVFADDKLLGTSVLRQLVEILERQPEVALASCASVVIDQQSQLLRPLRHIGCSGVWDGREVIVRCLETHCNLIGDPLFRRKLCVAGFDPRYRQIGDQEFCFRLLEQGRFAFIAEPLAAWRQRAGQQSEINRQTGGSNQEQLWLAQEWFTKPWMPQLASRQMLFTQIHQLRRAYGDQARELTGQMRRQLGAGWYAAYWLKRKITRPLKKISPKFVG